MKKKLLRLFVFIFLLLIAGIVSASEIGPLPVGGVFPKLNY